MINMNTKDCNLISSALKLRFFDLCVAEGNGSKIYDENGKEYIDLSSGWGVASLGYSNERVKKSITEQAEKLTFNSLTSSTNPTTVELAERLLEYFPDNYKVWFGQSGSDANVFISKIIPLATGRPRILSFVGSYHGQTMGAYSMSGHPSQGKMITSNSVIKIPYPYCYRCPFCRCKDDCDMFCLKYIKDYVLKMCYDPMQFGAMIFEAIECDGGDIVPPDGFFKELSKLCEDYGILVIADEVKIGFGRTGNMFGFEHYGITPDLVVMGKPIAGGLPLSAVVGPKEIMDVAPGIHLFTTAGNPMSCAAGIAVLDEIERMKLLSKTNKSGEFFIKELEKLKYKYHCIGDIRGRGLVIGVELVKDDGFQAPDSELAAKVCYNACSNGVVFFCSGIMNNVLEFTPPLIIGEQEIVKAVNIIDKSIENVINGQVSSGEIAKFAGWG